MRKAGEVTLGAAAFATGASAEASANGTERNTPEASNEKKMEAFTALRSEFNAAYTDFRKKVEEILSRPEDEKDKERAFVQKLDETLETTTKPDRDIVAGANEGGLARVNEYIKSLKRVTVAHSFLASSAGWEELAAQFDSIDKKIEELQTQK